MQTENKSRREFLKVAAAGSIGAAGLVSAASAGRESRRGRGRRFRDYPIIKENAVVLFQGDSITDAGRARNREGNANDAGALGRGYAFMAASRLLADAAAKSPKVYNRGISGNKVYQLAERWDKDCLELKPDLLSILIGVNDIWHKLNGHYDGTVETYEKDFNALLERTIKALPQVKLVICEPFVLRCGAVGDKWFPEFDGFRAASKRVAEKFDAIFVPFQAAFDRALEQAPPNYWAGDGVHPTLAGASLMARTWLREVGRAQ